MLLPIELINFIRSSSSPTSVPRASAFRRFFSIISPTTTINGTKSIHEVQAIILGDTIAHAKRQDVKHVTAISDIILQPWFRAKVENIPFDQYINSRRNDLFDLFQKIGIESNQFITSSNLHQQFVKDTFTKLRDSSNVYKGQFFGYFFTDRDFFTRSKPKDLSEIIWPNGKDRQLFLASTHEPIKEIKGFSIWFFRYSRYVGRLNRLLTENPTLVSPSSFARSLTSHVSSLATTSNSYIDIPISLPRTDYPVGVIVPNDETSALHSSFSNLLSFPSALLSQNLSWPPDVQLIQDDVPTTAFYMALLLALNLEIPKFYYCGDSFPSVDDVGVHRVQEIGNWIAKPDGMCPETGDASANQVLNMVSQDAFRWWAIRSTTSPGFKLQDVVQSAQTMNRTFHQEILQPLRIVSRFVKGFAGKESDDSIDILSSAQLHAMQFQHELESFDFANCFAHPVDLLQELVEFTSQPGQSLSQARKDAKEAVEIVFDMLQGAIPSTIQHFTNVPNLSHDFETFSGQRRQ